MCRPIRPIIVYNSRVKEWHIRREIVIDTPIANVWQHVVVPERISRWWCAGEPVRLVFEPHENGHFEEHYDDGSFAYDLTGRIVAVDPPHRLAIRRRTDDAPAPADRVDISLHETDGRTRVLLTHTFESLPADRRGEMEGYFADGWSSALEALRSALE